MEEDVVATTSHHTRTFRAQSLSSSHSPTHPDLSFCLPNISFSSRWPFRKIMKPSFQSTLCSPPSTLPIHPSRSCPPKSTWFYKRNNRLFVGLFYRELLNLLKFLWAQIHMWKLLLVRYSSTLFSAPFPSAPFTHPFSPLFSFPFFRSFRSLHFNPPSRLRTSFRIS